MPGPDSWMHCANRFAQCHWRSSWKWKLSCAATIKPATVKILKPTASKSRKSLGHWRSTMPAATLVLPPGRCRYSVGTDTFSFFATSAIVLLWFRNIT